jgi:hypothetical protein
MLVKQLLQQFQEVKNYAPAHVNELLDYLQKRYIFGELSIVEYKKLFSELDKLNAEKPAEFFFNTNPGNYMIEIPS